MSKVDPAAEMEKYCNRILRALERTHRLKAETIRKKLIGPRFENLEGLNRKIVKVLIFRRDEPRLFRAIVKSFTNERSPVNCFVLLDNYGSNLNPYGELTGGNFKHL